MVEMGLICMIEKRKKNLNDKYQRKEKLILSYTLNFSSFQLKIYVFLAIMRNLYFFFSNSGNLG